MSATRVLRERTAFLSDALDRSGDSRPNCNAAFVGITAAIATYPTVAAGFYGVIPQRITGAENEGASGTFTSELAGGAPTPLALNVGTQVPPAGTKVIVEAVGGRLVFRYDG